jgi:predicted TPR repeat methyltransferase
MNIAKFFQKALDCQKNEQPEMAITLYKEILAQDSNHLASLYNLATLHGERGEFSSAQLYYDKLIELEPDFVRAYFNAAVCQLQQKNVVQAEALLRQAVILVPEYSAAQHLLGSLIFKQGHWEESKQHFLLALKEDQENGELLNHLGMACLHLGELNEAEDYLKRSITFMPYLAEAQFHLGVIHLKRGNYEAAQKQFQDATDRDPEHFGAWYNLGLLYKQQEFLKLADECFSKAQAIKPDSEIIAFLRAAVNPTITPDHPPEGFVQELFDRYAGYYDAQMREGIDYQVPAQLYRCFKDHADFSPRSLTIVDLGCGTGLVGELFRPEAKNLRGIDLSSEMLIHARQKNIYDDLQQGDILEALDAFPACSIDLFIAADVLGYIGVLDSLFEKVYAALKPEGYWVFSIELGEQDLALSNRIRFTHSAHYIQQLGERLGFSIVHQEGAGLRKQIDGMVFVLRK